MMKVVLISMAIAVIQVSAQAEDCAAFDGATDKECTKCGKDKEGADLACAGAKKFCWTDTGDATGKGVCYTVKACVKVDGSAKSDVDGKCGCGFKAADQSEFLVDKDKWCYAKGAVTAAEA